MVDNYYRYSDNSFLKPGLRWVGTLYPIRPISCQGKIHLPDCSKPVVLDIISDSDIEDMKKPMHHRELRLKRVNAPTPQQHMRRRSSLQLDLLSVNEYTAGNYVREYQSLYGGTFTYPW